MGFRVPPTGVHRALRATTSSFTSRTPRTYKPSKSDAFSGGPPPGGFSPAGLGDFRVGADKGVVVVNTSVRKLDKGKKVLVTNLIVVADHLDQTPNLKSGTLRILAPNNGGAFDVPMYVVRDASKGWTRVVAQLNQGDLRTLLGTDSGLKFMAMLKFADGSIQPVNQHGTPFQNFTVAKEQLQVPRR